MLGHTDIEISNFGVHISPKLHQISLKLAQIIKIFKKILQTWETLGGVETHIVFVAND